MGNKEVKIDPAEEAKKQGKVISRAIRQIERELKKNEADEKKTLKLIKDMATKNQHGPAKIQAKTLVRMRNQNKQMYAMKSQLTSIQMVMSTARINQNMIDAMTGVNKVMGAVNENMNMGQIREICGEFAKQSEKMGMQSEMMQDQMDAAMDTGEVLDDADEVYNQILGEVGMQMNNDIGAGDGAIASANPAQPMAQGADDDMQARLDALKGL